MADPINAGANTFNNVNGMNPIIFSKKIALAYTKLSNKVREFLTNNFWEGEIKAQGDRVRIVVPNPEAINITPGDACPVPQGTSPEALDLVIDKQLSFALSITDKEKAQTQFKNWNDGMAHAVAQKIGRQRNTDIIKAAFDYNNAAAAVTQMQYGQDGVAGVSVTKYTPANHTLAGEFGTLAAPVEVTPQNAYQFVLKVKMALLRKGTIASDGTYDLPPLSEEPHEQRGAMIVGPSFAAILLSAYQLAGRSTAAGDMVVKDGEVTRVAGLDIHVDRTIEDTTITGLNTTGLPFLAGTKNAFTEASQISEVENIRDPYCFRDIIRGLELYGYKLVHPEALVRGVVKDLTDYTTAIPVVVENTTTDPVNTKEVDGQAGA